VSTIVAKRAVLLVSVMLAASALALLVVADASDAVVRDDRVVMRFSNPTPIQIPDSGTASPYPSEIEVSGLGGARISDVNLTLRNFNHTWPDDLDLLLVGPQGQNTTVMSDVGGGQDIIGINLTIDDSASVALPDKPPSPLQSGRYQPNNAGWNADTYPAPAPTPSGGSTLAAFNRTDPNGTWQLFVVDDGERDVGEITGGWSLRIEARL
jgi:subtilisin-like proprotein convertase family protein